MVDGELRAGFGCAHSWNAAAVYGCINGQRVLQTACDCLACTEGQIANAGSVPGCHAGGTLPQLNGCRYRIVQAVSPNVYRAVCCCTGEGKRWIS